MDAVQRDDRRSPTTQDQRDAIASRSFAPFRFPPLPYDTVQSPSIRELIREGTFDDLEYRRHVNELVYIEWYATGGRPTGSSLGPPITNFTLATHHPAEYDIVRRELDATIRGDIQPKGELAIRASSVDERLRRAKTAWQGVQEASR